MMPKKTRKQCKARLTLQSPKAGSKVETKPQTQLPLGALSESKMLSLRQKRKLGDVIEQDDTTCPTEIERVRTRSRGKVSDEEIGADHGTVTMGRPDSRPTTNQQGKNRDSTDSVGRAGDCLTKLTAENEKGSVMPTRDSKKYSEVEGGRKLLGYRVWRRGKEKQGAADNDKCPIESTSFSQSHDLNRKRKRKDLLDGIGATEDSRAATLAGPLTRRMAKTGRLIETPKVQVKKRRPSRTKNKGEVSVAAEEDFPKILGADVHYTGHKVGCSNERVELCHEHKGRNSPPHLRNPVHASSLKDSPLEFEPEALMATTAGEQAGAHVQKQELSRTRGRRGGISLSAEGRDSLKRISIEVRKTRSSGKYSQGRADLCNELNDDGSPFGNGGDASGVQLGHSRLEPEALIAKAAGDTADAKIQETKPPRMRGRREVSVPGEGDCLKTLGTDVPKTRSSSRYTKMRADRRSCLTDDELPAHLGNPADTAGLNDGVLPSGSKTPIAMKAGQKSDIQSRKIQPSRERREISVPVEGDCLKTLGTNVPKTRSSLGYSKVIADRRNGSRDDDPPANLGNSADAAGLNDGALPPGPETPIAREGGETADVQSRKTRASRMRGRKVSVPAEDGSLKRTDTDLPNTVSSAGVSMARAGLCNVLKDEESATHLGNAGDASNLKVGPLRSRQETLISPKAGETADAPSRKTKPSRRRGRVEVSTPGELDSLKRLGKGVPSTDTSLENSNDKAKLCSELKNKSLGHIRHFGSISLNDGPFESAPETLFNELNKSPGHIRHSGSISSNDGPFESAPETLIGKKACETADVKLRKPKSRITDKREALVAADCDFLKMTVTGIPSTGSSLGYSEDGAKRITRFTKGRGKGSGRGVEDVLSLEELQPEYRADEEVDQGATRRTACNLIGRVKLRSQKCDDVKALKDSQWSRPRKRVKGNNVVDDNNRADMNLMLGERVVRNCAAKDNEVLVANNEITPESHANHKGRKSIEKAFMSRDVNLITDQVGVNLLHQEEDGFTKTLVPARRLLTRGSRVDGWPRGELAMESGLPDLASERSDQPIGGSKIARTGRRKNSGSANECVDNEAVGTGPNLRTLKKARNRVDSGALSQTSESRSEKYTREVVLDKTSKIEGNSEHERGRDQPVQMEPSASVQPVAGVPDEWRSERGEQSHDVQYPQVPREESLDAAGTTEKLESQQKVGLIDDSEADKAVEVALKNEVGCQQADDDDQGLHVLQVESADGAGIHGPGCLDDSAELTRGVLHERVEGTSQSSETHSRTKSGHVNLKKKLLGRKSLVCIITRGRHFEGWSASNIKRERHLNGVDVDPVMIGQAETGASSEAETSEVHTGNVQVLQARASNVGMDGMGEAPTSEKYGAHNFMKDSAVGKEAISLGEEVLEVNDLDSGPAVSLQSMIDGEELSMIDGEELNMNSVKLGVEPQQEDQGHGVINDYSEMVTSQLEGAGIEVIEHDTSKSPQFLGTDVTVLSKAEKSEEIALKFSSLLNQVAETLTPPLKEILENSQPDQELTTTTVEGSAVLCQFPVSVDGPFDLKDGRQGPCKPQHGPSLDNVEEICGHHRDFYTFVCKSPGAVAEPNQEKFVDQLEPKFIPSENGSGIVGIELCAESIMSFDEDLTREESMRAQDRYIISGLAQVASEDLMSKVDTSAVPGRESDTVQLKSGGEDSVEGLMRKVENVALGLSKAEIPGMPKEVPSGQGLLSVVAYRHPSDQESDYVLGRNRFFSEDGLKHVTSSHEVSLQGNFTSLQTVSCTEHLQSFRASINRTSTLTNMNNANDNGNCSYFPQSVWNTESQFESHESRHVHMPPLSQQELKSEGGQSGNDCPIDCAKFSGVQNSHSDCEDFQKDSQGEPTSPRVGRLIPDRQSSGHTSEEDDFFEGADMIAKLQMEPVTCANADSELISLLSGGASAEFMESNCPQSKLTNHESPAEASNFGEFEAFEAEHCSEQQPRLKESHICCLVEITSENRPEAWGDGHLKFVPGSTDMSTMEAECAQESRSTKTSLSPDDGEVLCDSSIFSPSIEQDVTADQCRPEARAGGKESMLAVITSKEEYNKMDILGENNLNVAYGQELCASNELVQSSLLDGVKLRVVEPEVDRSIPLTPQIQLNLHEGAVNDFMSYELGELEGEQQVQLSKQEMLRCFNGELVAEVAPIVERSSCKDDMLEPEQACDAHMEIREAREEHQKSQPISLEKIAGQRNVTDRVRAPNISKKKRGRIASDVTRESELQPQRRVWDGHEGRDRDEDMASRVCLQKKGYLLGSTSFDPGGRRIRPRPLDPDQAIPIFLEGRDKELLEYDGGTFYRSLQQQEEGEVKKLASDLYDGITEGGGFRVASKTCVIKKLPIVIPLFRKIQGYQQTQDDSGKDKSSALGKQSAFSYPHAYLRYARMATRKVGYALGGSFSTIPSVYDMDDEDEKWLQEFNENLNEVRTEQLLSENVFEQLIELFEREFSRITQNSHKSFSPNLGNQGEKGGASGQGVKKLEVESWQRGRPRMKASRDTKGYSKPRGAFQRFFVQRESKRKSLSMLQNTLEECCICNGGENSAFNPVYKCQLCSINVHQSCYGICETVRTQLDNKSSTMEWSCRKCEAVVGGRAIPSISCAICFKSGGAMKPTVDPSKWAHVACALYTNETFFVDPEAMEPVDGLAAVETRVRKHRERCGLCGAKEGSCVRCSSRGCRAPFHVSCGVIQGASFELRHVEQEVVGVRSFCPRHATFVPLQSSNENHWVLSSQEADPAEFCSAVSTISSDTLETGPIRQSCIQADRKLGGSLTDEINIEAQWPAKDSVIPKRDVWANKFNSGIKRKRSGTRQRLNNAGGLTTRRLHPTSAHVDVSGKDKRENLSAGTTNVSKLKETVHDASDCMEETDICPPLPAEEKLKLGTVSVESSFHLPVNLENLDVTESMASVNDQIYVLPSEAGEQKNLGKGKSLISEVKSSPAVPDSPLTNGGLVKEVNSHRNLPALETLDTVLASPHVVKAVYSYWQCKRVKANSPILHEFKQLQAARVYKIFNKLVEQKNEILPLLGRDSRARIPTRRPRSSSRDPVLSKILELKHRLEVLRTITGKVVRREPVGKDDQELLYQSARQRSHSAREKLNGGHCYWCENAQNLLSCSSCAKAFCFQCFKRRRGYGVKGWIAASKLPKYVCNSCLGYSTQETQPELDANIVKSTSSEPGVTPVARVVLGNDRLENWQHGFDGIAPNLNSKELFSVNKALMKLSTSKDFYAIGSSSEEGQWIEAPGCGEMIFTSVAADDQGDNRTCGDRSASGVYDGGILPSSFNETCQNDDGVQYSVHVKTGKKLKQRRVTSFLKRRHMETDDEFVPRTTNRRKRLARLPSFVYGSEDDTAVSESDESRVEKTLRLSDLGDTLEVTKCEDLEQGCPKRVPEKGLRFLKVSIKFSSGVGKLILERLVEH